MEDNQIMDLYWQRSESAIAETREKYGTYCTSIARNILHSREDAEEVVNDTCLKAWDSMPPERPSCLQAYLGRITRNLSLDLWRREHARKRGSGEPELVLSELEECLPARSKAEQAVEEQLLTDCINRFLQELPRQKRNLFVGRYWYLFPVSELAERFGLRENNVNVSLSRMRKKLQQYLEKEGITL